MYNICQIPAFEIVRIMIILTKQRKENQMANFTEETNWYQNEVVVAKGDDMLYPISIQDFQKLRENGCIYVDKTDLVYKLTQDKMFVFCLVPEDLVNHCSLVL